MAEGDKRGIQGCYYLKTKRYWKFIGSNVGNNIRSHGERTSKGSLLGSLREIYTQVINDVTSRFLSIGG